jgi:Flp pilus assembly pilin Flp
MTQLLTWIAGRVSLKAEEGQTAVEYALVVALVALVIAGFLAGGATDFFDTFWQTVTDALG